LEEENFIQNKFQMKELARKRYSVQLFVFLFFSVVAMLFVDVAAVAVVLEVPV